MTPETKRWRHPGGKLRDLGFLRNGEVLFQFRDSKLQREHAAPNFEQICQDRGRRHGVAVESAGVAFAEAEVSGDDLGADPVEEFVLDFLAKRMAADNAATLVM